MNIEAIKELWRDTPEMHSAINKEFTDKANANEKLKAHRDWVQSNIFGFGERSFHWMWKLIIDKMDKRFSFLEVGVFRGQVLSLVQLLADMQDKEAVRYGVTPLTSEGGHWESDYENDIKVMHDAFDLDKGYIIYKGLSTDKDIIEQASTRKYDIVYIDGGHSYEVVKSDLQHYLPLVKDGGFLVVDDCCNRFKNPEGFFGGIETVSKAVDEVLPPFAANEQFEFLFSVVHNRVYKKIKPLS